MSRKTTLGAIPSESRDPSRSITETGSSEVPTPDLQVLGCSGGAQSSQTEQIALDGLEAPLSRLHAWQRFHIKLIAFYGGAVLLGLLLIGWHFYDAGSRSELESLQQRIRAVVTSLSDTIQGDEIAAVPLTQETRTPLHDGLYSHFKRVANQDPDVETIYVMRPTEVPTQLRFFIDFAKYGDEGSPGQIYDASGVPMMLVGFARPTVEDKPYEDEFGLTLSGYAPIHDSDGNSVGIVGMDVEASRIQAMQERVFWSVLVAFGVAATVIVVISLIMAQSVRKPLTQIIDAMSAIAEGALHTRVRSQRRDEFGIMSKHFDRMAQGLEEREFIRETFGRYVSEEVANKLLSDPHSTVLGGEERVVTVLMSDLRGYCTISERLPPAKVIELLNRYFDAMTKVIYAHSGCVIEFLGDGMLVAFGAPNYLPDHEEQAVRCAIEMRDRLEALNREWETSGLASYWNRGPLPKLGARIGIHSGPVIAGNLGGKNRMKYAVIGDTVNVASRLESMNKEFGSGICVSGDVYVHLPRELTEGMDDRDQHAIKGRDGLVRVYSL